ncbi:MAG: nuclear transport factor 2 family protein, partial [Gemmatimonadaceae bacterium]
MRSLRCRWSWGGPPAGKMSPYRPASIIIPSPFVSKSRNRVRAVALALCGLLPGTLPAQWSRVYDTAYLSARHNWAFRTTYPQADRLFNAFDYGHAILYEKLWTMPNGAVQELEVRQYDYLTTKLLVKPPRLPLEEMAIEPNYARLAPEAKAIFEWAHILHRQAYDVLADARLNPVERDAAMRDILAHYRSRVDLRLSERAKSMALMQEQPFSLAFRRLYPKFNGLIWAYHWLQIGLYEPLLVARAPDERHTLLMAAVARFRQMLPQAPDRMPYVMPMTAAVAPTFAARYPEFAIIFDNLHSLHDVISDILANDDVPRDRKRDEILRAAARYRDDTTEVMSVNGWLRMAQMMGLENQGGPAVGFAPSLPTPTVARGAVMRHDREGNMIGGEHAGHAAAPPPKPAVDEHAGHDMPDSTTVQRNDSLAVVQVIERFHAALAAGDSTAALELLADDAEIMESGGTETKAHYRSGHLRGDIAFARAVPRTRETLRVRVSGHAAWATSTSTSRGTMNGREVNSSGAESMVLARRDGVWRIVGVH